MFKKLFDDVKSTIKEALDEVDDEAALTSSTCYLKVADTSMDCFMVGEELTITFTEEGFEMTSLEGDGFCLEVPTSSILADRFVTDTIRGQEFSGSYLQIDTITGEDYIYLNASKMEPHFFLDCIQKMRLLEDLGDKRYNRTTITVRHICKGCGAAIEGTVCDHCGTPNPIEQETTCESDYEYYIEPQYREILQIHSTSIRGLQPGDKVFYHLYEDCLTLRTRGCSDNYTPVNFILLFENLKDYALQTYDNTNSLGLYLAFHDEKGKQYIQFKVNNSDPRAPKVQLDYTKAAFKLEEVFEAVNAEEGVPTRICDYCRLAVSTPVCPYCGATNE